MNLVSNDRFTNATCGKQDKFHVESLDHEDNQKGTTNNIVICISLSKPLTISDTLIENLKNQGDNDTVDALLRGETLYEIQECCGDKNIFSLCERYMLEIKRFIDYGIENGFIS